MVQPIGCDAPNPSVYLRGYDGNPVFECRCLVCARCGHHTGNSTQGHHWGLCAVTRTIREPHFCCPGDCELPAPDPHPRTGRVRATPEPRTRP